MGTPSCKTRLSLAFILLSLAGENFIHAQSPAHPPHKPVGLDYFRCRDGPPSWPAHGQMMDSFPDGDELGRGCDGPPTFSLALLARRNSLNPAFASSAIQAVDSVAAELREMGEAGRQIGEARQEVLSVFETDNSCSGWFIKSQADAGAVFRSLDFEVDASGEKESLKIAGSSGGAILLQPYVAKVGQNVAPGSMITLNANGAFFQKRANLRILAGYGLAGSVDSPRTVVVGPYAGGTIRARVLTLLHEFGHVMDLLPIDAGVPNGPEISTRNTETVLKHCKAQIEASARHVHQAGAPILFTASKKPM